MGWTIFMLFSFLFRSVCLGKRCQCITQSYQFKQRSNSVALICQVIIVSIYQYGYFWEVFLSLDLLAIGIFWFRKLFLILFIFIEYKISRPKVLCERVVLKVGRKLETGRKLNVHKTFIFPYFTFFSSLYTFNLCSMSRGQFLQIRNMLNRFMKDLWSTAV